METYKIIFYIILYAFVAIGFGYFGYWLSRIGVQHETSDAKVVE